MGSDTPYADQTELRQGPIERWSGKLLRWLMAYLFVLGGLFTGFFVLAFIAAIPELIFGRNVGSVPTDVLWAPALMIPYLAIRYRDPGSTTIPFASWFHQYL